jgi:two-component system chemotaxis response regulator CheY
MHTVKGGADFFDLVKIHELAEHVEDMLALIRSRRIVATTPRISALLAATDRLHELIQNAPTSNQSDNSSVVAALNNARAADPGREVKPERREAPRLRVLVVEDDFTSRLLLHTFLSRYGECHIAVNGKEAVEAFRAAAERGQRYDLICMDILMPEMDGREAVRRMRALEEADGILSTHGAKIVMTTTVGEIGEVIRCFRELCDAYLIKPIDLGELLRQMKLCQLVP